jgi:glyoxylase-like metal-dependent hydrolase (beta-lactamase superfamily II)
MKITDVKTYYCGYCTNNLRNVFEDSPRAKRKFPAAAFAFEHEGDKYLFDTGYSARVFENGWKSKIYNKLNPVSYDSGDSLLRQLQTDGVGSGDIKGIIISHLHPDHIGGLRDFPDSELIASKNAVGSLKNPRLFDLIFTNLLPPDFNERLRVVEHDNYDLFGDGSLILLSLEGHSKGQMGMLLTEHNTLYASDSLWGMEFIDKELKFIPKILQSDYKEYCRTKEILREYRRKGLRIIFSHEALREGA